jgi:hypothetical protein
LTLPENHPAELGELPGDLEKTLEMSLKRPKKDQKFGKMGEKLSSTYV